MKEKDIVFEICQQMLSNSPERSYVRLNQALRDTLTNCIMADLPFQPTTFRRIYNELRGGWWFGDGAGSHTGEHFYTLACSCNHAAAQQSFEAFADRPGCLWEENLGTPERLYVGAQFTWMGHYVQVTSLRKDKLVACTHSRSRSVEGMKVGAIVGYNPEHLITSVKRQRRSLLLRVVKVDKSDREEVSRRFIITYDELKEFRSKAKARVKAVVEMIEQADPLKDKNKIRKAVNAGHFRHFEFEQIRAALVRRRKLLGDAVVIEAWRKGGEGAFLNTDMILLRLHKDRVECSNGNSVSLAAARVVLPVVLEHRTRSSVLDVPLDSYRLERVSPKGVKIGCTTVPWDEVDRIIPELTA